MTVREIVDMIIKKTGVEPLDEKDTCDRLIVGDWNQEVTGVAVTFMATIDVIREAIAKGIQLIITHEPTWYTGADDTGWLQNDEIYKEKLALIKEHEITIWRFHDHMHMAQEDGIYRGVIKDLGWENYIIPEQMHCFEIPEMTLDKLCAELKEKLKVKMLRYIGKTQDKMSRVGVFVGGFSLGFDSEHQPMDIMQALDLDVVVCGDILEWTIAPYIRDASALDKGKAMIVVGHERSEEPGMAHMVEWLEGELGDVHIQFIDAKEPFDYC